MRTRTVLFVITLFVMQTYAMNMNAPDTVLDFESDELSTSGRSSNVMPAISDAMQQYILDTQDQNGDDDNDGDGIADSVDKDDDNDCIPDIWDSDPEDFDGDGINDADDDDDDDDGISDSGEVTDTDNMTNIYDYDNDGYHDCSSMGILHMNMLDVQANVLADGSVSFTIDASDLVSGESASMFWNLIDTDDFLQLNNSTTGFVVPATGSWGDSGTWYGLTDGPYCFNVELSGSDASGNSDVLDSEQVCFTIDSSSNGGGGGSGVVDDCGSNYNFSSIDSYEFPNGISPDQDFVLAVTSTCLVDGVHYDMMIIISDSSNSTLQTEYFDWFGSDLDETHFAAISGLGAGDYFLYVDLISITHSVYLDTLFVPFTIGSSTDGNQTELEGYCSFPSFGATPTELLPGDDLTFSWAMDGDISPQVYLSVSSGWGSQYYYSDIVQNDGSHTITLPYSMNPNHDYVIYIESSYDDNRSYQCWKYGSIDILFEGEEPVENETVPTPTVDETPRISMWFGKVNQHNENGTWMTDPDGVAGAGTYANWGDEGWGDRKLEYCQRFWPSTVDVVLRDLPEEIVFYTRGNTDGYVSMKPVWECILEEEQVPVLTGSCTIDLTVTPQEIEIGETLTMEWTMTGDIPAEVRVAVSSHDSGMWNVGVQYHVSQHIANTGIFEYVIPAGMNPDRDYVVYVDAVLTDDFTTYCWKYGSFDLLADNEGAIDEVIDNLFNTTDRTPRISMWHGKVNQHNENGTWMTDPDGTAGAGNYAQFGNDGWGDRKLEYCQRFWPDTLAVEPMGAEEIVFYTRGNAQAYLTTKPVWECVHDTDGDGEMDNVDVDDDDDGWTDILEQACGTNELDANDVPADADGDQICDLLEEAAIEAAEDSDGLPSVGFLATLAVLSVAFILVSRKELEE